MTKGFLLIFVYTMCTISIAWGCVSGAGPSWDIGQGRPGKPAPGRGLRPSPVGPGGPLGSGGSSRPSVPIEVVRYLSGQISKESAFASIDLDGNGLVSFPEWTSGGGAISEFNHMLIRLDINGDNLISLDELQPFSLPASSDTDTSARLLNLPGPREMILADPTPRPRRRNRRRKQRPRGDLGRGGAARQQIP